MYFLSTAYTFREFFYFAILFTRRLISFLSFSLFLTETQNKMDLRAPACESVAGENHSVGDVLDRLLRNVRIEIVRRNWKGGSSLSIPSDSLLWGIREIPRGLIVRFVPSSYQWKLFSGNASPLLWLSVSLFHLALPGGFPRRADWKRWWLPFVRMTALVLLCVGCSLPSVCAEQNCLCKRESLSLLLLSRWMPCLNPWNPIKSTPISRRWSHIYTEREKGIEGRGE